MALTMSQENYPRELEIKECHTYCTMGKKYLELISLWNIYPALAKTQQWIHTPNGKILLFLTSYYPFCLATNDNVGSF